MSAALKLTLLVSVDTWCDDLARDSLARGVPLDAFGPLIN